MLREQRRNRRNISVQTPHLLWLALGSRVRHRRRRPKSDHVRHSGIQRRRRSGVDRTLAAQALLAGIAERGADAVGYAHRGPTPAVTVHKQRTGASELLEAVSLPSETTQALVHVRDYTKGHPTIIANNHPIRHGSVVGIHNGIIENDELIFARYRFERAEPEMTVDSEAIFALMEATESDHRALEQLYGAMAAAWIDEREPANDASRPGRCRPIWLGRGRHELFFASTRSALEVVERHAAHQPAKERGRRGAHAAARQAEPDRSRGALPTGSRRTRRRASPGCSRTARGCVVPRAARRDLCCTARLTLRERVPSGSDADPFLAQPFAHEELERRPGARVDVDHPVDLPLGEQRRVVRGARPSSRPSSAGGRAGAPARAPWATARSSRSSPTGTSKPASRSAADSEPNVCQMSDFEATRPRCASTSRAVGDAAELARRARAAGRAAPPG